MLRENAIQLYSDLEINSHPMAIWLLASMTLSNAVVSDISETTSFEL